MTSVRVVPDVVVPLGAYLALDDVSNPLRPLIADRAWSSRLPEGGAVPAVRIHRLSIAEWPVGSGVATVLTQLDCVADSATAADDVARALVAWVGAARNRVDDGIVWSCRDVSIGPTDPEDGSLDEPGHETPQRLRTAVTARFFVRPL